MDWQNNLKARYAKNGLEAFRAADETFMRRLERFCEERDISIIDDNPEGQAWMILLKDGIELYVDRRSYDTGEEQTDFWVDYNPEHGGVVAHFLNSRPNKREIIIPNDAISVVYDEW